MRSRDVLAGLLRDQLRVMVRKICQPIKTCVQDM